MRVIAAADRIRARTRNREVHVEVAGLSPLADVRALGGGWTISTHRPVDQQPRCDVLESGDERRWNRDDLCAELLELVLTYEFAIGPAAGWRAVSDRQHHLAPTAQTRLDLSDVANPRINSAMQAYARSKLCVLLLLMTSLGGSTEPELQRTLCTPGFVATHFAEQGRSPMAWLTRQAHRFAISPKQVPTRSSTSQPSLILPVSRVGTSWANNRSGHPLLRTMLNWAGASGI